MNALVESEPESRSNDAASRILPVPPRDRPDMHDFLSVEWNESFFPVDPVQNMAGDAPVRPTGSRFPGFGLSNVVLSRTYVLFCIP